jgi:ribosomal subunit interface protein
VNYNIKGTGIEISLELRQYVEKKLEKADKFLQDDTSAHANVECEYSSVRDEGKYRAEFTLSASRQTYRAEKWGSSMHEAVDLAIDELVKELSRNKAKHLRLVRQGAAKIKDILKGFRR